MKQQIRQLVTQGKWQEAFKLLPDTNDFAQLHLRFHRNERDNDLGTLNHDNYTSEINRITTDLLRLLDDLEDINTAPPQSNIANIIVIGKKNENMTEYINELKQFIDKEYDEDNRQIEEIWAMPIKERVAAGEAIDNIYLEVNRTQLGPLSISFTATLKCSENISKFRKGSRVKLHKGNPKGTINTFSCEITEDYGNTLVIQRTPDSLFPSELLDSSGWILDNDKVDIRHIVKSALDKLLLLPEKAKFIYDISKGQSTPNYNYENKFVAETISEVSGFNPKQKEAFVNSFSTENFYLIQGPPGTGKTWLLAHIAHELAKRGENILITAFTHRAINNALIKTAKVTSYEHIIKIGQKTNADDLNWGGGEVRNYDSLSKSSYSIESKGVIIGATCYSTVTRRLTGFDFDTVIFDEAGQLTIPLGIIGMLAGKKYIFIGDHQQMPPIIKAVHEKKELTKSIFELLFEKNPGTMLNITYRMNKEINSFPSRKFYNGSLLSAPSISNLLITYKFSPQIFPMILKPENSNVFIDLMHENRGVSSPEEAQIISEIIKDLIQSGIETTEIAVIAPYRAQGRLIRKRIEEDFGDTAKKILSDIVVDTVERIQGQERDVIIISLTTSNPVHAAQRAEFYFKPNRLNVAITRPRYKRIVVGSSFLFAANSKNVELEEWINNFKEFYQEALKIEMKK